MELPLWGSLQKSVDDSETIEQAIARLISEHEADPEAHLGSGESLQNHKAESVIDHPAGSILADKMSLYEYYVTTDFSNISQWNQLGDVGISSWPGAYLAVSSGSPTRSYLASNQDIGDDFIDYTKDMLIEFQGFLAFDLENDLRLMLGNYHIPSSIFEGFGFYYHAGELKGFWGNDDDLQYTSAITFNPTVANTFRAQYDSTLQIMYFFLNGVQVASLNYTNADNMESANLMIDLQEAGTGDDNEFLIKRVTVAREY